MATTSVYLLTIADNHTIEINQDELRSLLGKIETELHQSKVYRHALATLQKLLGASSEQAKILFKAVGREAIGLAFQQFAQQPQNSIDSDFQVDVASSSNSSHPKRVMNPSFASTDVNPAISSEAKSNQEIRMSHMQGDKLPVKTELKQQIIDNPRLESLCQIGQQLKQARESKGMSLTQLHIYTHIQIPALEAIENGNLDVLPEDIFLRGFIRMMGNAVGLNGTNLAASLIAPDQVQSILPSFYQPKKTLEAKAWDLSNVHLYAGYTALIAGAVGGLSLISQQIGSEKVMKTNTVLPTSSSFSQSNSKMNTILKPGIKSSQNNGIIQADISPPEILSINQLQINH